MIWPGIVEATTDRGRTPVVAIAFMGSILAMFGNLENRNSRLTSRMSPHGSGGV